MAEAIAVIAFVSAISGLIDISSKVVKRLNDFQSKAHDIPQAFQHVKNILPVTIKGLDQSRVKAQSGIMDSETQKALLPALKGCEDQIRRIDEILETVLPVNENSSWDKIKKSLRSLSKDKEVRDLLKDLDRYVLNFTFHTASSASTVVPPPRPMQQVIMIPTKRDPKFVDRTEILSKVESNLKLYGRAAIAGIGGVG